jgi:hypothetical protein
VIEALLALVLLTASLGVAIGTLRLGRGIGVVRSLLFRAEILRSEACRLQRAERQLADAQRLTENVVAGGTQTVRAIHQRIAEIPFGILEAIPVTRDTTRVVRATHDLIAGAVYGGIGMVNRGVGAGLRAGLKAGAPEPAPAEAAEKAHEPRLGPASAPAALK